VASDSGLHFCKLISASENEWKFDSVSIPGAEPPLGMKIRACIQTRQGELLFSDFNNCGFMMYDLAHRSLVQLPDSDMENSECTKLLKIPLFDAKEMPYVFALTRNGLHLINVKVKKHWILLSMPIRDFIVVQNSELQESPGKLVYTYQDDDGPTWKVMKITLTKQFYSDLRQLARI